MEFRQLFKDGKMLMYQLQYKKGIKNITAKVTKDNKIQVTSPGHISLENIDRFIIDHFDKFFRFIKNRRENSLIDLDESILGLNGRKYNIFCVKTSSSEKYEIIGNNVYFHLKSVDNKQKILMKFYKEFGSAYLIKRANAISKKTNIAKPTDFKTKWYESKWGQCDVNTGVITLANQLVMFDDEIIDYVIIHELCHLIHPNHSPDFWNLVERHFPKYMWAKEKLKFQC